MESAILRRILCFNVNLVDLCGPLRDLLSLPSLVILILLPELLHGKPLGFYGPDLTISQDNSKRVLNSEPK